MKVAYLLILKGAKYRSVFDKVIAQVDKWNVIGADTRLFLVTDQQYDFHRSVTTIIEGSKLQEITKLNKAIDEFSPDIVYHRLWVLSPFLIGLLNKYKLVSEINTDIDEELLIDKYSSKKGFITYLYNAITRRYYYKRIHGSVAVTKELVNYRGLENCLVLPNSIDVESFAYRKREMERQIPSILFIGTPGLNWHGVDLLVKFAKYAKNRIHFHVVGFNDTSTTESLSNITFHGYLPMEKYSEIARQCSIGLGTLALHRKNMMEACPLKVREYLSAGLPSVLPYKDTAFLDERPDWILNVSSSEDGLSKEAMEKVIEFAQEYKDYIIPKEDVLKYIDSNALEQKRVDFFSCIAK